MSYEEWRIIQREVSDAYIFLCQHGISDARLIQDHLERVAVINLQHMRGILDENAYPIRLQSLIEKCAKPRWYKILSRVLHLIRYKNSRA
jgi:hypothetical protein